MANKFIFLIVLVVVSVFLLASIVCIVLLVVKNRNKNKLSYEAEGSGIIPRKPVNQDDHYQDFGVFHGSNDPKARGMDSFGGDDKDTRTIPKGHTNMFASGESAFRETTDDEDRTRPMLDENEYAGNAYPQNRRTGVTIQYYKNGVIQNYRMMDSFAVIGREQSCEIVIDSDTYISDQHAILFLRDGDVCIADLNSKNGTYVNDLRVKGVVYLTGREKVKVASSDIRVIIS